MTKRPLPTKANCFPNMIGNSTIEIHKQPKYTIDIINTPHATKQQQNLIKAHYIYDRAYIQLILKYGNFTNLAYIERDLAVQKLTQIKVNISKTTDITIKAKLIEEFEQASTNFNNLIEDKELRDLHIAYNHCKFFKNKYYSEATIEEFQKMKLRYATMIEIVDAELEIKQLLSMDIRDEETIATIRATKSLKLEEFYKLFF